MNAFLKTKILIIWLFSASILVAQVPAGYYNTAVGKSEAELKTALHNTIRDHIYLDYDISTSIWWYNYFKSTDWHSEGYFIDMYSNFKRSTYSGSLMNREHCMPRSWWGSSDNYSSFDANGDIVNLSPSDASANTAKSNYPLGVVFGKIEFTNGTVKVGYSKTYASYNGLVFEPANEYKGDFARTYMYMVTCYEDYSSKWHSLGTMSMISNTTYPVFKNEALNLLLEWSRNDPVSSKEINRNNAVYLLQGNRNPFIDYPVLAELIWGKYKGQAWAGDNATPETEADFYVSYNDLDKKLFVKVNKPETATYFIYSISGVVVQSDNIISADSKIDVSGLEKGMYIVKIYSGIRRKTDKFIVG